MIVSVLKLLGCGCVTHLWLWRRDLKSFCLCSGPDYPHFPTTPFKSGWTCSSVETQSHTEVYFQPSDTNMEQVWDVAFQHVSVSICFISGQINYLCFSYFSHYVVFLLIWKASIPELRVTGPLVCWVLPHHWHTFEVSLKLMNSW